FCPRMGYECGRNRQCASLDIAGRHRCDRSSASPTKYAGRMAKGRAARHSRGSSDKSSHLPITANERIGRAVVRKLRFEPTLELGDDALSEHLAQLYAPLVERINVPNYALRVNTVLVERNQLTQNRWRQAVRKNHVGRSIAFEDTVRNQPVRGAFRLHLLRRFPECERLRLRKDVREQDVVLPAERVKRLAEGDEVARNKPRSLVDQLKERV